MDDFKKAVEEFGNFFESKDQLFEMSNYRPKTTGLPMVIWLETKSGKEKHGPRIKVQKKHGNKIKAGEWVAVTVSDEPKIADGSGLSNSDFTLVSMFILQNKKSILDLWNGKIDSAEFAQKIN